MICTPKPIRAKGGRGERIRTFGLIVPNDARYQTALHPAKKGHEKNPPENGGFFYFCKGLFGCRRRNDFKPLSDN